MCVRVSTDQFRVGQAEQCFSMFREVLCRNLSELCLLLVADGLQPSHGPPARVCVLCDFPAARLKNSILQLIELAFLCRNGIGESQWFLR